MILSSTGFSRNRHFKLTIPFPVAEPDSCSLVNNSLEQVNHKVGSLFVNGFLSFGLEISHYVSVTVFNTRNKIGLHKNALVGICIKCPYHFVEGNVRGSQKHGWHRVDGAVNTHSFHYIGHGLGGKLFHYPRRYFIARLGQSPFQRDLFPLVHLVFFCIFRFPDSTIGHQELLAYIRNFCTWCQPVLHGQRVKERFYGGTYLPFSAFYHIVLEVFEVGSANISLYLSGFGFHGHERRTEITQVPFYRVHRRHEGINFSFPRENGHIYRLVEVFFYFVKIFPLFVQYPVPFASPYFTVNQFFCLRGGHIIGKRRVIQ